MIHSLLACRVQQCPGRLCRFARPAAALPSILPTPFNALSLTACRGRKRAGLLYVATYTFGCLTKHWNNFGVLLMGRIFCGVATSLLYSAFESWLVAEHFKVGQRNWTHSQRTVSHGMDAS